ncbi:MAG: glycosyltransferase [Leptothrix sp. (in: b-proteobacteria)]
MGYAEQAVVDREADSGAATDPVPPVMPDQAAELVDRLVDDRALLIEGIGLQNRGQADAAQALFERYLASHPADPAALYSLGVILLKRPETLKARALLDHAVQLAPGFAPLWFAHGSAVQAMGEREAALASYDRALAIEPDYTEVLINSGVLLRDLLRHAEALARFQRVLVTKPDYETALANCAVLLTDFKRSEEATAMFERLLAINPDYDYGLGMLCYERLHRCDWTDFDAHAQQIIDGVRAGKPACKSLALMALTDDAATQQQCAQIFSKSRYPVGDRPLWTGERYRHDKIRIAYVSPDLREHPVGHLMAGVFERHDKTRFETIAVSLSHDDGSRLRARMVAAFDHFIDARLIGSRQLAEQLRAMEVDVAIDLAGYTADSRSEVFSHRFAPAQVNYLGYPGTLGNGYMDYLIADRHVIPPEHQRYYDERVLYLPDNYLPAAAGLQIAERTPTRAECGLPDVGMVFCSFNHDYKISPHIFAVWMRILAASPGSVLWLMSRGDASQRNLRAAAQAAGVAPERLVFAQRVPRVEDHLARYRQADLFLDTHPYNAHTTAADALLAGLPVLTYSGNAFPARVAGSLLHAAGLPELVTHSLADYEALALRLAREPALLAGHKAQLATRRAGCALLDADGFTRNLEAVYSAIWRQTQLGGAADALSGHTAPVPLPVPVPVPVPVARLASPMTPVVPMTPVAPSPPIAPIAPTPVQALAVTAALAPPEAMATAVAAAASGAVPCAATPRAALAPGEPPAQPLFSVVVITHDRPVLLERALQSIRRQQVPGFEVEIVLIADEASAETHAVAGRCLGARDVFVRRNGRPGPAASRNLGVSLASGEHVMFLDDDDSWDDGLLAAIVASGALRADRIVYLNYTQLQEDRSRAGEPPRTVEARVGDLAGTPVETLRLNNFIPINCLVFPLAIARRFPQDPLLRSHEDWEMLLSCHAHGVAFTHLPLFGPQVHWGHERATQRSFNPDTLAHIAADYFYIYRKHPARSDAERDARQLKLRTFGLDIAKALL